MQQIANTPNRDSTGVPQLKPLQNSSRQASYRHRKIDLMGIEFDVVTERDCIDWILDELDDGRGGWLVTPNLHILRRCHHINSDMNLVQKGTLCVADGMPLIWASWIQGTPLPERVAGSTSLSTLSAAAAARKRSMFLIGGSPGTAEKSQNILQERHPGIDIRGCYYPEFGFEKDPGQIEAIRMAVREANADIVYIALSFPKGEILIDQLRQEFPSTWFAGIGISFSFLCGEVNRAPRWIQRIGFEWVYRVYQEPRRLTRRYFVEGLPFASKLFVQAAWRRLTMR